MVYGPYELKVTGASTPVVIVPPAPAPIDYKSYIAAAAGIITFGLLPIIHQIWPAAPSFDITQITGALGILVSVGIAFHRWGLEKVAVYILQNIVPAMLPQLEALVTNVIQTELQKADSAGLLSDEDIKAVHTARLQRAASVITTSKPI